MDASIGLGAGRDPGGSVYDVDLGRDAGGAGELDNRAATARSCRPTPVASKSVISSARACGRDGSR